MKNLSIKTLYRTAKTLAFSLAFWVVLTATALAKKAKTPEPEAKDSYVISYALVMLGVVLGMLVVCRSANRRDRAKPETYDEKKLLDD